MRNWTTLVAAAFSLSLTQAALADDPPSIVEPARAQYGDFIETDTPVSVLGADDNGEGLLTYAWSATGPAPVGFAPDGTNAAKNSVATFGATGAYTLQVTVRDASGQTVTSSVPVYVSPRIKAVRIEPASAAFAAGSSQPFVSLGIDQFGAVARSSADGSLNASWSVSRGGGTIDATGLVHGDSLAGGPHTVSVFAEGHDATATFTLLNTRSIAGIAASADAYVRDGTSANTNFGTATTLVVKSTGAIGTNRISYLRFPLGMAPTSFLAARLRLYGSRTSATALTDSAWAVYHNSWTETGLTWNNRPPLDVKQGASVTITPTAGYYEWDVTDYLRPQTAAGAPSVSLAVAMDTQTNDAPDTFNSRQAGSNRPELRFLVADETAPTIEVPASASPAVVRSTTTQLSVRGADDGGEAALTYTWSTVGTPPAPVSFSINGTNAAKNTVATFSALGDYDLRVVIRDATGKTVASPVHVNVFETVTQVVIRPPNALVPVGGQYSFHAYGIDQFGNEIQYGHDGPLEGAEWSVSGGGTIVEAGSGARFEASTTPGGPFTVMAVFEGIAGTASVTVAATTRRILAPIGDTYVRDGASAGANFGTQTHVFVRTSDTAGQNNIGYFLFPISTVGKNVVSAKLRLFGYRSSPSPVFDTAYGVNANSWSETALTWNTRLPLAEEQSQLQVGTTFQFHEWDVTRWITARRAVNAPLATLAIKMDAPSGGPIDDFNSREALNTANRPQLVVTFMEDAAPVVVTPASASPSPVAGTTTRLSVLGGDDGGEGNLTYTWESVAGDVFWGNVTFSANGSNAAKDTTATFENQGSYDLRCTIRDAGGRSVTSTVHVEVEPTLTRIVISPDTAKVGPNETAGFVARGYDQFGRDTGSVDDPYLPASWSVSGGGTIDGGLFTAGPAAGGPFTITATAQGLYDTAQVTIVPTTTVTLGASADAYVRDGASASTNYGTATVLNVKKTATSGNNRIAYLRFPLTNVAADVTRAILRVYGSRPAYSADIFTGAHSVSSNSWSETGLTWNNKPARSAARLGGVVNLGPTAQYYEFDVTSFVHAQRAAGITSVSLALEMGLATDAGPDVFNSREATGNRPQLVVTSRP